jgi:hypothetical protein
MSAKLCGFVGWIRIGKSGAGNLSVHFLCTIPASGRRGMPVPDKLNITGG